VAHVEAPLTFLQVQVERVRHDAVELLQPMFGEAPEALDAVDVMRATGKLILSMIDSITLRVTDIDESVIAAPAVRMNNCLRSNTIANNSLQSGFRADRHDLRIDFVVALQQPEDRSLARSTATTLATDATSTEVAFIDFDLARKWRCADEF